MSVHKWLLFLSGVLIVTATPIEEINGTRDDQTQTIILIDDTVNNATSIIETARPDDTETPANGQQNLFEIVYNGMTNMFTLGLQRVFVLLVNYISGSNTIKDAYKHVAINKGLVTLQAILNSGLTELRASEEVYIKLNKHRDMNVKASNQDILISRTLKRQLQDLLTVMETGSLKIDEGMAALLRSEEASEGPPSKEQQVFERAISEFETRFIESIQNIKLATFPMHSNEVINSINRQNINQEGIDNSFENVNPKTAASLNKPLIKSAVLVKDTSEQIGIEQSAGRSEPSEKHDHHSKPPNNTANAECDFGNSDGRRIAN